MADNHDDDHDNKSKGSVSFAVVDNDSITDEEAKKNRSSTQKRGSKRNSLQSSFFRLRTLSFKRSDGHRGADIDTLRGTSGPDFEGYAVMNRAAASGFGCCMCLGRGKDLKEQTLLIKGPYLFVFSKETEATTPKYAIDLAHMKAVMQNSSGTEQHMTIETTLGDVEWELTFQQQNIAKQFADVFKKQAAVGEADEVRKRLGHEDLLKKRSSVKYAKEIATKKREDQPEKRGNPGLEEYNREVEAMAGF